MYSTTQPYKDAIYAPSRRTVGKVTFDITDVTAYADVLSIVASSEETGISDKTQLTDRVRAVGGNTGTWETDRFKLNGTMCFPDDTKANNGEMGYVSSVMCDSAGVFASGSYPTLTIQFNAVHSSLGVTVTFDDTNGEYAVDYDVAAYDSIGALITTVSRTGNTNTIDNPIGQLVNYKKIIVTIKKWSTGNRRARVLEVDFGIVKVYTGDNLIAMSMVENLSLDSSNLPSAEFTFTVDNSDRAFNILNPTGFYKFLQQRQKVYADMGVELPDGSVSYVPLGQYYLGQWLSEEGSLTTKFTTGSSLDLMSGYSYENLTATTKTLSQFAADIFAVCGIPSNSYSIDTALASISTNTLVKKANCKDILQMIAIAGCANVYVDRSGVIQIKTKRTRKVRYIRDWLNGSNINVGNHWVEIQALDTAGTNIALSKTVTASAALNGGTLAGVVDGVTTSSPYLAIDVPPAWVKVDLGAVYDIATVKVWHYYADARTYFNSKTEGSVDGVTWFTIFDSAVSGTYAESSSGKTTALETCRDDSTVADSVLMDNTYNEPQISLDKITKQVDVKYWTNLSTSATVSVVNLGDGDSLTLDNNTLINDATRAAAVANWVLGRRLNGRAAYTINWRGNPAQELMDNISIENTYGSNSNALITRTDLQYEGYLKVQTEARGVPN